MVEVEPFGSSPCFCQGPAKPKLVFRLAVKEKVAPNPGAEDFSPVAPALFAVLHMRSSDGFEILVSCSFFDIARSVIRKMDFPSNGNPARLRRSRRNTRDEDAERVPFRYECQSTFLNPEWPRRASNIIRLFRKERAGEALEDED